MVLYAWFRTIRYQIYGTISKKYDWNFSFVFLNMVLCAWYPTIWYQAYGTMYQQGTYFRSYVCTYIFSFIRMYVCMDVRTYENTKKNFGIYVTGKYRKVWYHIKKTVTTLFVRYWAVPVPYPKKELILFQKSWFHSHPPVIKNNFCM